MADFREYVGITLDDYLQHHGILGMMWGKRNGPPYPLGTSDHSASEKKAGWKKSLNGADNRKLYDRNKTSNSEESRSSKGSNANKKSASKSKVEASKRRKLTNGQKVAMIYLGAVGALTLYAFNEQTGAISRGKAALEDALDASKRIVPDMQERINSFAPDVKKTYDSLINAGFKPLEKAEAYRKALRKVNPLFLTEEGQSNCFSCSFAYTLRTCFGLDVTAIPSTTGATVEQIISSVKNQASNVALTFGSDELGKVAKSLLLDNFSSDNAKHKEELITKMILNKFKDEGAQGIIMVQWNSFMGGGHAFNWKIENGKVKFIDAQRGVEGFVESHKFFEYADLDNMLGLVRLDNAEFDMDQLKKLVKRPSVTPPPIPKY